jgi:TolA-binding protein
MSNVRRGLVVVACVSVGFIISAGPGLVARAAEPDRWVASLRQDADTDTSGEQGAQHRIAQLEQRIRELEGERSGKRAEKSSELSAAQARNDELASRNRELSLENQELVSHGFDRPAAAACTAPSDADPKAQLRYWAKQLRDDESTAGRLSSEWRNAVNLLLRHPRPLDPHNPWRDQ